MFIPLHDANYLKRIRIQYVTLAIILVNCLIWVLFGTGVFVSENASRATLFSYGFIPAVANGYETLPAELDQIPEFATYVSYAFLHADFWHLLGNMLFIWVFGDNVEDAMGHFRFFVFFMLCAAAGALFHSLIQPDSVSPLIGASGAAAGIIAAYLMLHPRVKIWILFLGRIPIRLSALWVIGAWIAFQLFNFAFNSEDQVSWGAHIGGLLAGAILLPLLKDRDVPLFDRQPAEEVIPPVAPPAVAKEGHKLPGQSEPKERAADKQEQEDAAPAPWGRQPRDR